MLKCEEFYNLLIKKGIDFFIGVPDSLLKDFCNYIYDHTDDNRNIIAANEGNAIALAAGYYLATNKIALVYMQNSGQGNAINPLVSLTDKDVYSIPLLLLIGWRGEPGKRDEQQHIKQGKITLRLLSTLGIKYNILPDKIKKVNVILDKAIKYMRKKSIPYALIVRKGTFEPYKSRRKDETSFPLSRESALKLIVNQIEPNSIIVSTTGKTSRELFEYREALNQGHEKDFLTVGSMGHASQIALSIAMAKPNTIVYCFDGDGAIIMHMGALATIGLKKPRNFKHIVFNNGAHDSVGGQPTAGLIIDIPAIAKACGYRSVLKAETLDEITQSMDKLKLIQGPAMLEIKVNRGARENLGRPTTPLIRNKIAFMKFLQR